MLPALSIALSATTFSLVFLAAWVIDLRARSLQQETELRSLRSALDRVAQDVVTLWAGDRRHLVAEQGNAVPDALARTANHALGGTAAADSAPPSAPQRRVPPDVTTLLVRSLAGGDRGANDESPGAAVISGAQEELALVAEMLLAIDTKTPEAAPEPAAIGSVLTALSDRILVGLELLAREGGGAPPPPPPPPAADDDEPPSSSDPGGGALPH